LKVYTGVLGQIGDIIAFTPTARSIKERFPGCEVTFAVSRRYREAVDLIAGLPCVDNIFATEHYSGSASGI
jgi:ADP-heptose:LPS heptosyltransferase